MRSFRAGVAGLTLITLFFAAAAVAQALVAQSEGLVREEVMVRIIFARLAPFEQLTELACALHLVSETEHGADGGEGDLLAALRGMRHARVPFGLLENGLPNSADHTILAAPGGLW